MNKIPLDKTVMFVDDDPINNRMHELLFAKLYPDIEVLKATSVDEAIAYLKEHPDHLPSRIFLDLNLPIKDGWQFLQEFQPLEIKIDIYLLTSSIDIMHGHNTHETEVVKDFLEKPLRPHQLKAILT